MRLGHAGARRPRYHRCRRRRLGRDRRCLCRAGQASKLDIVDTETFKDDSSTSFINQPTKAMRKIKIEGLTGELTWNDEGQVEKPAAAYVIRDGKYIAA